MIPCVDCGRVLLNDVQPASPASTTKHKTGVARQVRAARQAHTCPGGHMKTTDQCSRCDFTEECVDRGMTTLEEVAQIVGCPTPSLHVHLVQHDRDDLLRRLTYGGQPILPAEEQAAEQEEAAPEPPVSCQCDAWEFDPGETEFTDEAGHRHSATGCDPVEPAAWADGPVTDPDCRDGKHASCAGGPCVCDCHVDPQEAIDAGGVIVPGCGWSFACGREADHDGQCCSGEVIDAAVMWLSEQDEDDDVRRLAQQIRRILEAREQHEDDRALLADLVDQRDDLNAQIEELARRLGDLDEPEPVPLEVVRQDGGSETARIRAWAREQGRKVIDTGRLPKELVEEFREAHA